MGITRKSKHGQHHERLVGFSTYIEPELKAIVQVSANEIGIDMVEVQKRGFLNVAYSAGVTDKNGKVLPKYRQAVDAYVDIYLTSKENNKKRKGEK